MLHYSGGHIQETKCIGALHGIHSIFQSLGPQKSQMEKMIFFFFLCLWAYVCVRVKYGVSLFYPDSVPAFDRIIMSAKRHRWSSTQTMGKVNVKLQSVSNQTA